MEMVVIILRASYEKLELGGQSDTSHVSPKNSHIVSHHSGV